MKLITTHLNADFDCLASMVAAHKLFPSAAMVFSGSMEKPVQEYLQTIKPPLEFTRLKDVDLNAVDHLILVDTHDPERIGAFKSILNKEGVSVHIYDHHPEGKIQFPADQATIQNRGACTTILCEIMAGRNISLSPWEATLMALGIYEDTNSLTSPSSTPEDFIAVSQLIKMGADLNAVADFIQPRLNQEQLGVMNDLIANLELHNFNGVEVGLATATADHYIGDLAIVVHQLVQLENLSAFVAMIRLGKRVYLIARSRMDKINAAEIANEFSGGGHAHAASACARDLTLVQVREKLLAFLADNVEPVNQVGDVMHFPVVSVNIGDTVDSAEKVLTRFNLNTLPVLLKEEPVGLITRQVVEKAIHHGLEKERIDDFMVREFRTTEPSAWLKTIIPIIIEEKQKLVPVVNPNNGRLVGVVSRGDILSVLHQDMHKYSVGEYASLLEDKNMYPKNMKSLLNERLSRKTMDMLGAIGSLADSMNLRAYVVGGFVRDLLLGVENLDIDVVAEGDGTSFANELSKKLGGRARNHEKFGTSVVILEDGMKIDVATARIEFYQRPAALPTVEMGSIKSDLFRRDFTFNSLAIILNGKDSFNLVDYFNGQRDLKEKTVRVLHNLSFVEDPCRVFRAVRFEQRFKFTLGKQTQAFLQNAVKKRIVDELSGHRFYNEIISILKEKKPLECIRRMQELDLLKFIHPNILQDPDGMELLQRVEKALSLATMFASTDKPEEWKVYLLAMLSSLDEKDFNQTAKRLSFSDKLRDRYKEDLSSCNNALEQLNKKTEFLPSEIFDIFSGMTSEAVFLLAAVSNSESTNKRVLLYYTEYAPSSAPALSGEDLVQMGIKPGPVFKTVLQALRSARLDGLVKTREDELALVKKNYLNP